MVDSEQAHLGYHVYRVRASWKSRNSYFVAILHAEGLIQNSPVYTLIQHIGNHIFRLDEQR